MIEAMLSGLLHLMGLNIFGMMLLGVVIGIVFGVIPGLGGVIALAVFIPFVFGMDPFIGIAFLLSMHAVVTQGGAITAVLIGIPGTSLNVPTTLDGYALAKQGRAGEAIGAALTASAVGGVFGAVVLLALIPLLRPIAMALTPAEIFMLIVFGLTFIIALSRKNLMRGFIAALLGLGLSTIRLDPHAGIERFTFGQMWLWDGISIIPLVLGMFAFSEMIALGTKGRESKIAGNVEWKGGYGQLWEGFKSVFRHWWLSLRTSALGVLLGIVPGIGGDAGSWICYGHAAQTCRNNENFGKGDIRGVIAPEVANNAKEGGALLPTVVFGIPGSTGMAVLLGAFMILGLTPGPAMIKEHLDLLWSMAWVVIISNIIASVILFPLSRYMIRLVFIRAGLLIPAILAFSVLGALLVRGYWQDLLLSIIFGILGFGMMKTDFPRAPVILGFILGHLAEENLYKAYDVWGASFLLRPVAVGFLAISVLSIVYSLYMAYREKTGSSQGEIAPVNFVIEGLMVSFFAAMFYFAMGWPRGAQFFPQIIAITGFGFSVSLLIMEILRIRKISFETGRSFEVREGVKEAGGGSASVMIIWLFALFAVNLIFGFWVGCVIFMLAFMRVFGREKWITMIAVAAALMIGIYLVLSVVLKIPVYGGLLGITPF